MTVLAPLPVFIPLLVAALLAVVAGRLERRIAEAVSIATAVASTALSLALLFSSIGSPDVYWFSGWRPRHGIALGVSFSIDPIGAGAAATVGFLITFAFLFAWHYFEETVGHRFHILMLLFLGAMAGFALTGDLFNLFVWFELMSVAAYALTGYEIERPSAIQGGLNFGIINTIGGF